MSLQLKVPTSQFPQGGFPFLDPRTGFKCNGMEGTPQMHAVKIREHRRANPRFYPPEDGRWFEINNIVQEIYGQKFKTHPHLFKGYGDAPPIVRHVEKSMVSPTLICACGSNEYTPEYCKTCGGRRITGYKCSKCGKEVKP